MVARERSGTQFDPDLVDAFCEQAPMVLSELDDGAELGRGDRGGAGAGGGRSSGEELDHALEAIGEFAELKSPWMMGHVARRRPSWSPRPATSFGLPSADAAAAAPGRVRPRPRPARGSEHDLGQARAADRSELERVRLHPYLSERMLAFSPALARAWRDRGPASRATRRLRLSRAACPATQISTGRAIAGRGRRLPRAVRAAPAPAGSQPRGRGRRVAPRGHRRAPRRRRGGQRCCGPPGTASAGAASGLRA